MCLPLSLSELVRGSMVIMRELTELKEVAKSAEAADAGAGDRIVAANPPPPLASDIQPPLEDESDDQEVSSYFHPSSLAPFCLSPSFL